MMHDGQQPACCVLSVKAFQGASTSACTHHEPIADHTRLQHQHDTVGTGSDLYQRSEAAGIPHAFVVDASNHVTFSGHPMDPGFEAAVSKAAAAAGAGQHPAAPAEKQPLPRISESYEQLMAAHSAKELKAMLTERGIDVTDCFEKGDLAKKIVATCANTTYYK